MKTKYQTGIFSDDLSKAVSKLKAMIQESDETIVMKKKNAIITDKREYTMLVASKSARGFKFTDIYVDKVLKDTEVYQEFVLRCLFKPLECKTVNYKWSDHIHWY